MLKYPKARRDPSDLAVNSNTLLSWHKHGNVYGLKCSGGVYTSGVCVQRQRFRFHLSYLVVLLDSVARHETTISSIKGRPSGEISNV